MTELSPGKGSDPDRVRSMTVVRVFEPGPGRADWEVIFSESARYYRLVGPSDAVGRMVQALVDALSRRGRVVVRFTSPTASDIVDVGPAEGPR